MLRSDQIALIPSWKAPAAFRSLAIVLELISNYSSEARAGCQMQNADNFKSCPAEILCYNIATK
jgi:hypothetical protein